LTLGLVLSLFPGIGLLDRAFEEEGFCVVRGPDLIWGGDVRGFHPPTGKFEGIVGGPPCQAHSQLRRFADSVGGHPRPPDLIPEFARCVIEASPVWFVMENVPSAPSPIIAGYDIRRREINNRWFGAEQSRQRAITFGACGYAALHDAACERFSDALAAEDTLLENPARSGCFTANGTQWEPGVDVKVGRKRGGRSRSSRTWAEAKRGLRLQGLPEDHLDHTPLTAEGAIRVIGNGVPLPMGRAVARAVKAAIHYRQPAEASVR